MPNLPPMSSAEPCSQARTNSASFLTLQVPNLFPKDELAAVLDDVRTAAKAAGAGETQELVSPAVLRAKRVPH